MRKAPDAGLSIQSVSGRRQLKEFIALPQKIYAQDQNWVAPLRFEQMHRFTDKNPFFEHATWNAWIARRNSRIVGRISAQIDELYQQTQGDNTGFFGLLEAEDDAEIFTALLSVAETWLQNEISNRSAARLICQSTRNAACWSTDLQHHLLP